MSTQLQVFPKRQAEYQQLTELYQSKQRTNCLIAKYFFILFNPTMYNLKTKVIVEKTIPSQIGEGRKDTPKQTDNPALNIPKLKTRDGTNSAHTGG